MSQADDIPHLRGEALVAEYKRRYGDKTMLSFSRGKDSIATALWLRDKIEIIPVYFEDVPGLEFIQESLAYYEKHLFGRRIIRMPHPAFYKHLRDGIYQTLGRFSLINSSSVPIVTHKDIIRAAALQEGVSGEILTAVGLSIYDNVIRLMTIRKHGPLRPTAGNWCPIWDWPKSRLFETIEKSGVSLPADYTFLPRSFDGLSYIYLEPIRKAFPRDYAQILHWFPLAATELKRHEIHQRLAANNGYDDAAEKDRA